MIAFASQLTEEPDVERRPPRVFEVGSVIDVPKTVADSGWGKIVGCEWGPDNGRLKKTGGGWIYSVAFGQQGAVKRDGVMSLEDAFLVSEEELRQWQKQLSR